MKGSQGIRRRTRDFKVIARDRGKIRIKKYLQEFRENDRVSISIDPSYQSIPHPRFQGLSGSIMGHQGRSYYIKIKNGNKTKKILVPPEHLTPLK